MNRALLKKHSNVDELLSLMSSTCSEDVKVVLSGIFQSLAESNPTGLLPGFFTGYYTVYMYEYMCGVHVCWPYFSADLCDVSARLESCEKKLAETCSKLLRGAIGESGPPEDDVTADQEEADEVESENEAERENEADDDHEKHDECPEPTDKAESVNAVPALERIDQQVRHADSSDIIVNLFFFFSFFCSSRLREGP